MTIALPHTGCMNSNIFFLKSFRILLFPFALGYGLIIWIRNRLYDWNILKSTGFNLPVICVGNLTVGGTGKSPMVEYLAGVLKERFRVATMSRGYKRRSSGYILADGNASAVDIGDEPMQLHIKHPDIAVAVGEERLVAIPQLLYDKPDTEVIVLDDAFQHRTVTAGLNILLTDCNNLYTRDFFLPTGDLRDERSSARRADIIVVTKCKTALEKSEKEKLLIEINPLPQQEVFFSSIHYGLPYHIVNQKKLSINKNMEVLLVCGIANPEPLKRFILEESKTYDALYYNDHHIFSIDDLKEILKRFDKVNASKKIIITTEKDAVRLAKFHQELKDIPFYVLPIGVRFLFDDANRFNDLIVSFISTFTKTESEEIKAAL